MYGTTLLMAVPLEAREGLALDLLLYSAMRARSCSTTSLAVIGLLEAPLRTGITTRFSLRADAAEAG